MSTRFFSRRVAAASLQRRRGLLSRRRRLQIESLEQRAMLATDFSYGFFTVYDTNADQYLVSSSNVHKNLESDYGSGQTSYWNPRAPDVFSPNPSGTLTYRFDFGGTPTSVFVESHLSTWRIDSNTYGRASLWGSTDGASWQSMLDLPTPTVDGSFAANYEQNVPASLVGSSLWLQVRMEVKNNSSNLAQFSRSWTGNTDEVFRVVAGFNQSPAAIALTSAVIAENQASGTVVGRLSSSDPDVGDSFTYSLVGGTGGTDNALFEIVGDDLRAKTSFDYEAQNSLSIRVRSTDVGGLYTERAFTIAVDDRNDAPVNTVPATQSTTIAMPHAFTAYRGNQIAIADIDAGALKVQVTLSVDKGTLTLLNPDPSGALTYSAGDGTEDASMTFTGTVADINAALAWVSYRPNGNVQANLRQWAVADGGNGHWYEYISSPRNWAAARSDAESRGGYLAAVTSASENGFVQTIIPGGASPWLGGYQDTSSPSYSEPAGGWRWVTGEPWTYTNWGGGEPNNSGTENHLQSSSVWNDLVGSNAVSYLIEYDTDPRIGFEGTATLTLTTNDLGSAGVGGAKTDTDTVSIVVSPAASFAASPTVPTLAAVLDTSFNGSGKQVLSITAGVDFIHEMKVMPDGKILAVGAVNDRFGILRFNADMSLDSSFGAGGGTQTDFGAGVHALSFTFDSSGRIVVVGGNRIARYTANGVLDTTFGTNGSTQCDNINSAYGVAIQPDGKIVATGRNNEYFRVMRFTPSGSVDGDWAYDLAGYSVDYVRGLVVRDDGDILLGGRAGYYWGGDWFSTYRLNSYGQGELESNYDFGGGDFVHSLLSLPDGKILLVGRSDGDLTVSRHLLTGELDTSFGSGGRVKVPVLNANDEGYRATLAADGKILITGFSDNGVDADLVVVRFSYDGVLDTSFGVAGKASVSLGGNDYGYAITTLPNGKILVAGRSGNDIALVRLLGGSVTSSPPSELVISASSVAENSLIGTVVGTLSTIDPDAMDNFNYTLVSGTGSTDNAQFIIAGNLLKTAASFNYESKSSYSIRVRSTDAGGLFTERVVVVSVEDVSGELNGGSFVTSFEDGIPTGSAGYGTAFLAAGAGTAGSIGLVLTRNVTSQQGSWIVEDVNPGSVLRGFVLNYKQRLGPSITSDYADGASVNIAPDLPDASLPEGGAGSGLTVRFHTYQGHAPGRRVDVVYKGQIIARAMTDPFTGNTFADVSMQLVADGRFSMSYRGEPLFADLALPAFALRGARLGFGARTGAAVEEAAIDDVHWFTQVSAPPTGVACDGTSVAEGQPSGTTVGRLSTTDPDVDDTFTYSLVSGVGDADNTSFEIVGNEIRTRVSFVYEAKSSYSIRVRSADQGGLYVERTFTITVSGVNEPPTAVTLGNVTSTVNENTSTASRIKVAEVLLTDDAFGTNALSLSGADAGSFEIVGTSLYLKAGVTLDFETKGSYAITVLASDSSLFGSTPVTTIYTLTVANVNEGPTTISLSASAVAENQPAGTSVGTFSTTDPDSGDTFTYSLVSGTGSTNNAQFTIVGNQLKTAATFDYETKSSWLIRVRSTDAGGLPTEQQFTITVSDVNEAPTAVSLVNVMSTVNENTSTASRIKVADVSVTDDATGTNALLLSGAGAGSFEIVGTALYLKAGVTLDYETKASYAVNVLASDPTLVDSTPASTSYTLWVTNINEVPTTISLSSSNVAENLPTGTAIGMLSTTDPDAGDTFTYTLVSGDGGADNALFEIVNGVLKTQAVFDYETKASYSIRVRTTDSAGLSTEQSFMIAIVAKSDLMGLSTSLVAENAPLGSVVATITRNEILPDLTPLALYYVPSSGQMVLVNTTAASLAIQSVQILSPFARMSGATASIPTGASFSTANTADGIYGIGTEIFFASVGTAALTLAGGGSWDFGFVADVGLTRDQILSSFLTDSEVDVLPGSSAGQFLYSLVGGDSIRGVIAYGFRQYEYSLVPGIGDTDNALFSIVGKSLKVAGAIDYEAKSHYSIRVRSTAQDGTWIEEVLSVDATDVNEAPTAVSLGNLISTVNENTSTAGRIKVADIVVTDDALGTNVLSLSGADAASFEIEGAALYLKSGVTRDHEAKGSYAVTVSVADSGMVGPASVNTVYTLTVIDVNEGPTAIGLSASTVQENMPTGSTVGTFSATDPDVGDIHRYNLIAGTGDADNGSFEIVGGFLTTKASLNYESQSSYTIRVRTTDAEGLFTEKQFTISVADVNEAPTAVRLVNTAPSIAENTGMAARVKVADIAIEDDALGVNTLILTGSDKSWFEIDGRVLYLKAGTTLDYGAKSSYDVVVDAFDSTATDLVSITPLTVSYGVATGSLTLRNTTAGALVLESVSILSPAHALTGAAAVLPAAAFTMLNTSDQGLYGLHSEIYFGNVGSSALTLVAGGIWSLGNVSQANLTPSGIAAAFGTDSDVDPEGSSAAGRFLYSTFDGTSSSGMLRGAIVCDISAAFTLRVQNVPEYSGREYADVAAGQTVIDTTSRTGSRQVIVRGGGTLVLAGVNTHTGGTRVEGGTLTVRNASALGAGVLDVRAGGVVNLDVGYSKATVGSLSLATGARINLGTGGLQIAAGGTTLSDLRSAILLARNGGTWNGTSGIGSASVDVSKSKVVGYRQLPSGAYQVAWAALGDTNLDGRVNSTDISTLNTAKKFGLTARDSHWSQGDFSYDGRVNSTDIQQLSTMYGKPSYYAASSAPSAPERQGDVPAATLTAQLFAALGVIDPDGDGKV